MQEPELYLECPLASTSFFPVLVFLGGGFERMGVPYSYYVFSKIPRSLIDFTP